MMQKILVLTNRIADAYQRHAMPHQQIVVQPRNGLLIGYYDNQIHIQTSQHEDVLSFAGAYMPGWSSDKILARFLALCFQSRNIPFVPKVALAGRCKLSDMFKFTQAWAKYPRTFYSSASNMGIAEQWAMSKTPLTYPLIAKHVSGWKGVHNYRVHSRDQLLNTVRKVRWPGGFFLQEYIENDNYDYRIVITNSEPTLIVKRTRRDDTKHTNNLSGGAKGTLYQKSEIDPAIWQLAVKAAIAVDRIDCCGVDIVIDKTTQEPYLMETNSDPSMMDMHREIKIPPIFQYLSKMCDHNPNKS